ncbi:MAG: redoxin domain-containing protein [Aliivibrio sp.]|uniref:TlpA family protein disulfide reductase n=1 Tax=Aliivibrio sp. TaxID=1872443 RepID=UPI001A3D820C|nr:redoxin domain-containing protein [Aliivibrio sp.]
MGNAQQRKLKIELRGVYDSNITLTPFNGIRFAQPLIELKNVKAKQSVLLNIHDSLLPGEFLITYNYRKLHTDQPYPAEQQLYLNKEDIEIHANPLYLRGDSLIFINDIENTLWNTFVNKRAQSMSQISLLEQLLQGYSDKDAPVWLAAKKEWNKQQKNNNKWIDDMQAQNSELYVSKLFAFSKLPDIDWTATPKEQLNNTIENYFKNIDVNDTLLLRSRQMNQFMGAYMGIFGQISTSIELRDSLFARAGELACQVASKGHPKVYGWFVDYFYKGYESYNITKGMQVLEKHLQNPNCLTSKRMEIARRLEGIAKLVPGAKAPKLTVKNAMNQDVVLNWNTDDKDYHLVIFYESDCGHCEHWLKELNTWMENQDNNLWMSVSSIALDDDRETWLKSHEKNKFPWTDYYAPGGVNSAAASNYFVLSTPNVFVVDKKGVLLDTPQNIQDLTDFLHKDN